jgi:NitT/TauT family transport system substrate-binding protein
MGIHRFSWLYALALLTLVPACNGSKSTEPEAGESKAADASTPMFSLAWSEYPSWSVFGVANELGLIDGAEGKLGSIEQQYGIDIKLEEASYDTCLNMFTSNGCDAVCMTNMDALIVSPGRDGVAVLPTSTSKGADACLVSEKITSIDDLKNQPVYGLKGTVSEYCFVRCLELAGYQESDFNFTNQDPGIAALNMQQGAETHQAIMVWNPFVLQTLRDRSDVRVLFDSSQIPGEIVDMVVIGADSLSKPKAEEFVKAVAAAFYAVNRAMDDPETGDEVLVALGKKFSNLGLEDMREVVQQTVFYKTPSEAKSLLEGEEFQVTMKTVTEFCQSHDLVKEPSVGYGADAGTVKLRFDASYLDGVAQ